MPTVIDALTVELGLNPAGFRRGQAEAQVASRKLREAAVKDGQGVEKAMESAGASVERLARNFLKLFALFTAGRTVKDFVGDITAADAAVGRLARSIGSTPEVISSLANAVARNGGSANAAAGSFERLADTINEIKVTGNSSAMPALARLQGATGKQIRLNTDLETTFGDMAEAARAMADKGGVSLATYLLKQAGVDADTAALLVQGRDKLNEAIAKSRRVGVVSEKDAKAAQALQTSIETLRQTSESFGRTILTAVTPTIVGLLKYFQELIEKNKEWIQTNIVDGVKQFATWLKNIPWNDVLNGIKDFVVQINGGVQALGGWLNVAKLFLGLWVGSKFLAVLANIGLLRTLLLGGRGAGGLLGGVLGLGALGVLGGTAAVGGVLAQGDPAKSVNGTGGRPDGQLNPGDELPGVGGGTPQSGERPIGRARRFWNRVRRVFGGGAAEAAGGEDRDDGIRRRGRRSERATDEGRMNARQPEGAGIYRPEYKPTDADLSQRTADIIAGEAIRRNPESIDAVVNNMLNRVGSKGWGPSGDLHQVATAPGQYEAAWKGSKASPSETEFIRSRIRAIASGGVPDNTGGANSYRAESYYRGAGAGKTWARTLGINGKVVGGNRYTYDPSAANGPYAPYAAPKSPPAGAQAPTLDQTRKAAEEARGKVRERNNDAMLRDRKAPALNDRVAQAGNGGPSAQQAGAMAAMVQARAAQSSMIARTMNDNRSATNTTTNTNNYNGPMNIVTQANDANGMFADLESRARKGSFVNASNSGQA